MIRKVSHHNKQVVEMLNVLARKPRNVLKAISRCLNAAAKDLSPGFFIFVHGTNQHDHDISSRNPKPLID
jgi:hypothetical protein